jgi:phospholipid/cholesterol/gamma-HCH transport system substrate-binding protein
VKFLVFLLVSVAAATLVGITLSGRAPGGPSDDYHAVFADASNLVAGDEVRVAGIRVGTVGELSITDSNRVMVTFSAQRTVAMTTGTRVAVKYKNLVGDRYLELTAGDGHALRPDGTIPVGQTVPALDLDALFNGFKPLLAALSPDQVNSVSGELVTVLQGEGGTIDELLAALASVTSTLADRDQVIGDVITNLDAALARVNTAELGQLITQLQQLVGGLNADRDQIGDAVTHIDALTGRTAQLLGIVRP